MEREAAASQSEAPSPELMELGEIIKAYSEATAELQRSHEMLQGQVHELSGELRRKNQALSETVTQVSSLKNYLAGIILSSADGIVAVNLDRRVMAWNPAADVLWDIMGDKPDGVDGKFILDVMTGSCREFGRMLMQSLSEDKRISGVEMRLTDKEGRTRFFSASASPVRNAEETTDGRAVGAVLMFTELTAMRELEDRANRQDRLAALGEMAAGVAHEIRNPLGGIELYASTMRRKFADDSAEHATCGKIIAAAASLNRIVTDMLTFTRGREPQVRRCQVGQVVRTALDLAARELEARKVTAKVEVPPADPARMLDPDQLAQAALNVILNAAQAMKDGGVITVSGQDIEEADGKRVLLLSFADEGPGIPDEAKKKIFDPFFTLRKDGTGLGLAIVHKIVQDHGGSIDVADNQPHGAVVTFRLPCPPVP